MAGPQPISLYLCAACRTSRSFCFSSSLDQGIALPAPQGEKCPTGINRSVRAGLSGLSGRQDARLGIRRNGPTSLWLFPRRTDLAIVFAPLRPMCFMVRLRAVPRAQRIKRQSLRHVARARNFWRILVPPEWFMRCPGLANLWMVLIKGDPAAVLAGHRKDSCNWARGSGRGQERPRFIRLPPPRPGACGIFWRCWSFTLLYPCVPNPCLNRP